MPPPNPLAIEIPDGDDWNVTTQKVHVAWLPQFVNDALNNAVQRGAKNAKRFAKDRSELFQAWIGSIPTALFFMVPFFALLLRVFYLFTPWTYLEHLVVALYSHAFMLIGLLLAFLLIGAQAIPGLPAPAAGFSSLIASFTLFLFLLVPLYLLWMQKRVYAQSWVKTLGKYATLGLIYSFLLGMAIMYAVLAGLSS